MHMSPRSLQRQRGATLLVVLVMLVMITLFVLSMIRLSNTNLRVVGNMQAQKALASSAQQAIEVNLSTIAFFNDAINNTGTWAGGLASKTTTINGYTITYTRPTCIYALPATGYSATSNISPEDTDWELTVSSTDPLTGATTSMAQGVKMRLPQGNCP
jgi:Tfp pilus assembly protein PilX